MNAPAIALSALGAEPVVGAGVWRIVWRVVNLGSAPLTIHSARLPHGQFKSDEILFDPALQLAGAGAGEFRADVRCQEPPGLVTENAFVIFYGIWQAEAWRIYVRIKVTMTEAGVPESVVESITTQVAGFSGVIN